MVLKVYRLLVVREGREYSTYIFGNKGAQQRHKGPEENSTAQNDLSVETVPQVTENGRGHHETADEDWKEKQKQPCLTFIVIYSISVSS